MKQILVAELAKTCCQASSVLFHFSVGAHIIALRGKSPLSTSGVLRGSTLRWRNTCERRHEVTQYPATSVFNCLAELHEL